VTIQPDWTKMSEKQEIYDKIFLLKDFYQNKEDLLSNLLKKNWNNYNNHGGGSTLIGRSTNLFIHDKEYEDILKLFLICVENTELNSLNMDTNKFIVREYDEGSYMTEHEDGYSYVVKDGNEVRPEFTIIIYLNDDYIGGELNFTDLGIVIKPTAGSAIVFPSYHNHAVNKVESGKRYLVQTYVYEKELLNYEEKK
jgi:Rps23 Pro-64 3,4-dihydroxylase Tpa1-like proline 4-hydroxylase